MKARRAKCPHRKFPCAASERGAAEHLFGSAEETKLGEVGEISGCAPTSSPRRFISRGEHDQVARHVAQRLSRSVDDDERHLLIVRL